MLVRHRYIVPVLTAVVLATTLTSPAAAASPGDGRADNPREHHAHVPADPCAVRLTHTWRDLGHFSDAFETYLLSQPPCS